MPPQSSSLFIFSGRATSVGEQKSMEQLSLFDVLLERNEHHEPPRAPLQVRDGAPLPASVPGVLRTEQLRRDGQALLDAGRDARLRWVGFRVAADAAALAKRWGYR